MVRCTVAKNLKEGGKVSIFLVKDIRFFEYYCDIKHKTKGGDKYENERKRLRRP